MAKLLFTPENQIQRLNLILGQVEKLQKSPLDDLIHAPHKSWNTLEVLKHLSIAYSFYELKIQKTLEESADLTSESWSFKSRWWQGLVIKGQRPKNGKRTFKIKTLKRFEPLLDEDDLTPENVEVIFEQFSTTHNHLKTCIIESRKKQIWHKTFSSAVGSIVTFYLPEAFEFLICHAERHMIQIDEILALQT